MRRRRRSKSAIVKREIDVKGHKFDLEIYLSLEGVQGVVFELFPRTIGGMDYSFSHKKELYSHVAKNFIYD